MQVLVRDPILRQYLADSVIAGRVSSSALVNSNSCLTELLRHCGCVCFSAVDRVTLRPDLVK